MFFLSMRLHRRNAILIGIVDNLSTIGAKLGLLPAGRQASTLLLLEKISFWILLVLAPFRLRRLLVALPVPGVLDYFSNLYLFASDAALALLLIFWLWRRAAARQPISKGPWFIGLHLAALTVMGFVSSLVSVSPVISLYHAVRLAILFLFYLYILNEVRSFRELVVPVGLGILLQGVIGIAQYFIQQSIGLYGLGEWPLDLSWEGVSIVWAPGTLAMRAYALTDHPNILGGMLVFGILIYASRYFRPWKGWDPVSFAVVAVGSVALLLTFSRAAWLAMAIAAAVVLIYLWRQREGGTITRLVQLSFATSLVLLPFLIDVSPFLGSRLFRPPENLPAEPALLSPEERSAVERRLLVDAGGSIFSEHAILGVGLGTFPIAMQSYFPDFPFAYQPVHFLPLTIAAETGLFGALFYFLLVLLPWVALWAGRRRLNWSSGLAISTAMLAGSAVISIFDYYLWFHPSGRIYQWMIWGLWAAFYQRGRVHE